MPLASRPSSHPARSTILTRSAASAVAPVFSLPGFSLGGDNSTACPPGLVGLTSAAACQFAVFLAGSAYTYIGSGAVDYLPKGCVWFKAGGRFYFNENTKGASRPFAQPVCAGAPHPICVRACVCV
jgi:hypothetical protein